jgi:DnaJ-class molecular chaperone
MANSFTCLRCGAKVAKTPKDPTKKLTKGMSQTLLCDNCNKEFSQRLKEIFDNVKKLHKSGLDRHVDVRIGLEETALGCEREIEVDRLERCSHCGGSKGEPGSKLERCPTCKGTGKISRRNGRVTSTFGCPECHGEGRSPTEHCHECGGTGQSRGRRRFLVKIPKGVVDGARVRLAGAGDRDVRDGPPGDVYVHVAVLPKPPS